MTTDDIRAFPILTEGPSCELLATRHFDAALPDDRVEPAVGAREKAVEGSTMHYVARWRMHVALTWLKEEDAPVSEMASRRGYESEAAFSRAFKRFLGFAPGAVRRARSDQSDQSAQAPYVHA